MSALSAPIRRDWVDESAGTRYDDATIIRTTLYRLVSRSTRLPRYICPCALQEHLARTANIDVFDCMVKRLDRGDRVLDFGTTCMASSRRAALALRSSPRRPLTAVLANSLAANRLVDPGFSDDGRRHILHFQRRPGILRRALASVLDQEIPPDVTVRVLVVDDGSPAPARTEIACLGNATPITIELIEQKNAGVAAARNAALRATADCHYVAFLDSDDVWAPTHLSTALLGLERGSDFFFCDAQRDQLKDTYFAASSRFDAYLRRYAVSADGINFAFGPGRFFDFCLRSRPFQTSTVVFRRHKAPELRFDERLLSVGEDSLFFLQLLQRVEGVCCSTSVNVRCADGENIYYSQAAWDDPGHLARQMGQVRASDAFLETLSLSHANGEFIRVQRAADRRKFAFLSVRHVLKNRRWPPALPTNSVGWDRNFLAWYLPTLAAVCAGYLLGLYTPIRPFETDPERSRLRILIASSTPYLPQYHSGANTDVDQLCRTLSARGHHVAVLVGLLPSGWLGLVSRARALLSVLLTRTKVSRDVLNGYRVWRTWLAREAVEYVVRRERPDVVVVAAGEVVRLAQVAMKTGVPVHMMLTDVEFAQHGGDFASLAGVSCTSNSRFTASVYEKNFGTRSNVSYPLVNFDAYRTTSTNEFVVFINPHPIKGRDIALEIARRCPEIEFVFVKSWLLGEQLEQELAEALTLLPNVSLLGARDDMKTVYGICKILLAPSLWSETFGRVITEAQASGIPAVASDRGGLPEAVGPGGAIVDPEGPIEAWVEAVRRLWRDNEYYAQRSAAALEYSRRPEHEFEAKADAWEENLLSTVSRAKPRE